MRLIIGKDDVSDAVEALMFSNVDPGGFEAASFEFPRLVDVRRGEDVRIENDGAVVWEGRVSEIDKSIAGAISTRLGCQGYGARLKETTISEVYVSRDLSQWSPMSSARRINRIGTDLSNVFDHRVSTDVNSGLPALVTGFSASDRKALCEAYYDAGSGATIKYVYYDFLPAGTVNTADANHRWFVQSVATDDVNAAEGSSNLRAASGSGYHTFTTARRYAQLQQDYQAAITGDGKNYEVYWRKLAVFGNHKMPLRGAVPGGFYPSDIVENALVRSGTGIIAGQIEAASNYIVPHAEYRDPVSVEQIISDMAGYMGWHWGTWESASFGGPPELWFSRMPATPTAQVFRSDCNALNVAESLDNLYNVVKVAWRDPAGAAGVATVVRDVPDLIDSGITRTLTINGGLMTEETAEIFGAFILMLSERMARGVGSVTLPATVNTAAGPRAAMTLKAGRDRLRINDFPGTAEGRAEFHVKRIETRVGKDGAVTTAELGLGANLIEVLQARLAVAAHVLGIG